VPDERRRDRKRGHFDGKHCMTVNEMVRRALAGLLLICTTAVSPNNARGQESPPPSVSVERDDEAAALNVIASIEIPARPQAVYAVMVDCSRALRIVTGLESCRVIERSADGKWDVREHIISVNVLLPRVRNVFRSEYDPNRSIRFRRVDGDLRMSEGEWRLAPVAGGTTTIVSYRSRIAWHMPIPGPFLRAAIRYDVPNTLNALRRESLQDEIK
jgi:ribosome-associated toxin RatA of RatAB toxin-antitoxin module